MDQHTSGFDRHGSKFQHDQIQPHVKHKDWSGPVFNTIYAGISVSKPAAGSPPQVAIALRDPTYLLDFIGVSFPTSSTASELATSLLSALKDYSDKHLEKILGVAIPRKLEELCPSLCPSIWAELDIVPIVLDEEVGADIPAHNAAFLHPENKPIDEQAESLARKCITYFGPNNLPFLHVGFLGEVEVDSGFRIRLASIDRFERSVRPKTWEAINRFATELRERKVRIAFFSATPQGGGVALMRHALLRLAHELKVDIKWYVPKPRPGVFRITKTNHNILQGVATPNERLLHESQQVIIDWIQENADRYWLRDGGPLCHPADGGADVIIIDDPQMPALIPIAKKMDRQRPVIYRSHIQMRADLIDSPGSAQAEVWDFLWDHIQDADIFISHPVSTFVPANVPREKVGYMPACTDWLDGLNKNMRDWDIAYYGRIFNHICKDCGMPTIDFPDEEYFIQIARFDPAKGIFDVLTSYQRFNEILSKSHTLNNVPKLLICGHGSVDDPDGSIIYDEVLQYIDCEMPHLKDLICVIRLGPSDQMLNALLSKARIVLQLSHREGFEVKVSEAIHKGKPVIATRAGGIPLQVEDGKNGFLVDVGDTDSVANHLIDLWTNPDLYEQIRVYSLSHVSDEVSTVGHAINWLFLASELSKGVKVYPQENWIQDMARRTINQTYTKEDGRLKRSIEEGI